MREVHLSVNGVATPNMERKPVWSRRGAVHWQETDPPSNLILVKGVITRECLQNDWGHTLVRRP